MLRMSKQVENIVRNGEIAHYKQFLLFYTVFSIRLENFLSFTSILKFYSANSPSLEEFGICCLGKGMTKHFTFSSSTLYYIELMGLI